MEETYSAEWLTALEEPCRSALELAALLERFREPELEALQTGAYQLLDQHGWLMLGEEQRSLLPPALQSVIVAALEQQPERQRELYGQLAHSYARQLQNEPPARRPALEDRYIGFMRHYCELLIQQQPLGLSAELAEAPWAYIAGQDHRALLLYYRGLGYGLQDHYAQALEEFVELLKLPGLLDEVCGRTLNAGAIFSQVQGNYEQALGWYEQSLALWRRLGDEARLAMTLRNLGTLHYALQDYTAAERELREGARIFAQSGPPYQQAISHIELGLLYRDQGRWAESIDELEQAALLFERTAAPENVGRACLNLGEVELLRGNAEEASAYFAKALAHMETRIFHVDVLLNQALLYESSGALTAAIAGYQRALALARELGREEIVPQLCYRLGRAAQAAGELELAREHYEAAMAEVEQRRAPLRSEGLLISLMGRWQQIYEAAVLLALEQGQPERAFDYAERARARAFADLLARRESDSAEARQLPLSAAQARAALPEGTLLLCYYTTGLRGPESALHDAIPGEAARLRACLSTPPRTVLFVLERAQLSAQLCQLNPNVLQSSSAYQADGRRFLSPTVLRRAWDALVAPVAPLLERYVRLLIVPHGPLHQLPFAALLEADGRPLLERALTIAYSPSVTLALRRVAPARPRRARQGGAPLLALGYDGDASRGLRHTEPEALAIAALCGGVAWRGQPGVIGRLVRAAGRYRWLHLACHGEFNLADPLESWLELGPGERLSASDVLGKLRLRADLVTLSACRSGVSKVLRGDEPLGLVRAFLSAGARAALVTLWPVEDVSARLVMERFYGLLLAGGPQGSDPAAALREAQQQLRQMPVAQLREQLARWGQEAGDLPAGEALLPFADPGFWAAYVLVEGAAPPSTSS